MGATWERATACWFLPARQACNGSVGTLSMCCNDVMALRTKTPKVSLHYSPLTPVKSPYLPTGTRLSSPPWIGPRACALVVDRTRPCYQIGPSRARSRRKRAVESGHRRCPCPVKAHMGGGGRRAGRCTGCVSCIHQPLSLPPAGSKNPCRARLTVAQGPVEGTKKETTAKATRAAGWRHGARHVAT